MFDIYKSQVALLLRMLPFIAEEDTFALKGGTAINLFVQDFPRLSVDIDLLYLPFSDRDVALQEITKALRTLKAKIESKFRDLRVEAVSQQEGNDAKLLCIASKEIQVKIEVNTVMRGHLFEPRMLSCVDKVVDEFEAFAQIKVASHGELYGGKICAALDRQHPRDLFDIYYLLKTGGITEDVKIGFIAGLLSHPRPIHEVLGPNFIDQREVYESKFFGMAFEPFSYEQFEETRQHLSEEIKRAFTDDDKKFLLSFKSGEPDLSLIKTPRFQDLPAVKWKLINLRTLIKNNPQKHHEQYEALREKLGE